MKPMLRPLSAVLVAAFLLLATAQGAAAAPLGRAGSDFTSWLDAALHWVLSFVPAAEPAGERPISAVEAGNGNGGGGGDDTDGGSTVTPYNGSWIDPQGCTSCSG
jgi:hypothetical protein